MGYASLSPVSVFEIGSPPQTTELIFTTGGGTFGLKSLDIPSWLSGKIKHAYLDWHIVYVINNHADFNWIDTCTGIQISPDSGLNWYQAIDIENHLLYSPATSVFTGDIRVIGTYDLTPYVNQALGFHWLVNIVEPVTHADDLRLFHSYCVLRVYMES